MNRFIQENGVFVASVAALTTLIALAAALSQKGTVNYTYQPGQTITPSSTTSATSKPTRTASHTAAPQSPVSTAQQTATTVAPVTKPASPTPAVQPSIRHRGDDEGGYNDN
jgi:hypothetical protein